MSCFKTRPKKLCFNPYRGWLYYDSSSGEEIDFIAPGLSLSEQIERVNKYMASMKPKMRRGRAELEQYLELLKLRLGSGEKIVAAICTICSVKEADILLDDCCHIATCEECVKSLQNCPICRAPIINHRKVYIVT